MPQGNVGILREALPENAPANVETLLGLLDDKVEWDFVGAFPEGLVTYHGPEEVRAFLQGWAGAFDDFGFQADEAIEEGDCVAVHVRQWGRGKDTGARVESRTWQVFRFRNGKIVHCHGYGTKDEALAAASSSR
jgi:ketosteroid isomerase-like protein